MKKNLLELEDIAISIPQPLENLQLPNPELITFYKNLEERVLWVDYSVDESILEVSRLIIEFNREDKKNGIELKDRKPIKLLIYSYGGDGQACFSLLDVIVISKTPVHTYNMGVAMSAGLLILLAGHKRFCLENSTALAHSGSGGAQGTFEQTKAAMKDYERFVEIMRKYILNKTKITPKLLNKHKTEEWYIYAEEQFELGIVDGIVKDIDDLI